MCACCLIQPLSAFFRVVTRITLLCSWGRIRVLASCLTPRLTRTRPSRLREVSHGNQTCVCMYVCALIQPDSQFRFHFQQHVFRPSAALLLRAFPTSSTRATVLLHCTTNTRMPPPRIDLNARLGAIGKGCWNSDQRLSFTSSTSEMYWLLCSCLSPKLTHAPSRLREVSHVDHSCVCMCACPLIQPLSAFFRVVTQLT